MRNDYIYYNRNPDNLKIEDCVCRAISTATGISYEGVNNLLDLTAYIYNCEKLCVCCYHNLLENILCYKRYVCKYGETAIIIAREFPRNTLLIRLDGHLTCAINGNILDIWDCSQEEVDCFWIVE